MPQIFITKLKKQDYLHSYKALKMTTVEKNNIKNAIKNN